MRSFTFAPRSQRSSRWLSRLMVAFCAVAVACSEGQPLEDAIPASSTGGFGQGAFPGATGGGAGVPNYVTGGATSTGGFPSNGGVPFASGGIGNGGAAQTGGAPFGGTGGTIEPDGGGPDGSAGDGGSPSTGGAPSTGGSPSTGGVPSTGGAPNTGGAQTTGGAPSTGGAPNTGGVPNTGGAPSTGGAPNTGGVPNTGGAQNTGGAPETGGAPTTGGAPNTGGAPTTGGVPNTGGAGGSGGGCNPLTTNPNFVNLAPPMSTPLDVVGSKTLTPPAPTGWVWYEIPKTTCRDGSPAGFFVHMGTAGSGLLWYLEGGGACINNQFCTSFNPANVNQALSGTGETVLGSAFGVTAARQQPGVFEGGAIRGIFDTANTANPFKDWSMIYTPYCTGDAWFGSQKDGTAPGLVPKQQFTGYLNMREFASHIVPTFKDKVSRVILTGASAGGFGAALNFSMVQDSFGCIPVDVIDDSGPPFTDQYMPACMQKKWRTIWGLDNSLPPDCTGCFNADGGGLLNLATFLLNKHPNAKVALVSSMNDEVIRLFYSPGLDTCARFDTLDPVQVTVFQGFGWYVPAATYAAGLGALRTQFNSTGRFATYYLGGTNITFHQHLWRQRFYDPAAGTEAISVFTSHFLVGTMDQIGP